MNTSILFDVALTFSYCCHPIIEHGNSPEDTQSVVILPPEGYVLTSSRRERGQLTAALNSSRFTVHSHTGGNKCCCLALKHSLRGCVRRPADTLSASRNGDDDADDDSFQILQDLQSKENTDTTHTNTACHTAIVADMAITSDMLQEQALRMFSQSGRQTSNRFAKPPLKVNSLGL